MKSMMALPFIALTFISWGVYGVLLHNGQDAMGHSSLRPFVGVGLAYFLIAVVVPVILMRQGKEKGYWSMSGTLLSLLAGSVGALGALGVILALAFKGSPAYVMPLVFGGAPVVNTIVTMAISKTFKQINPIFITGIVMVLLGAVGVLVFKPAPPKPVAAVTAHDDSHSTKPDATEPAAKEVAGSEASEAVVADDSAAEEKQANDVAASVAATTETAPSETAVAVAASTAAPTSPSFTPILLSIIAAAVCWGAYGPVLHIGQMKMGGSRLRPFCCVGLAYFGIAVAAPLLILQTFNEPGNWTMVGLIWSIAAGSAGAIGALGIILAFNFGGKPIYVMPLIFGFAPVVNTLTTIAMRGSWADISLRFLISMTVVVLGAITVLIFAPKPKPHGKPAEKPAPSPTTMPATNA